MSSCIYLFMYMNNCTSTWVKNLGTFTNSGHWTLNLELSKSDFVLMSLTLLGEVLAYTSK